ncbi:MAG: PrsW family intramembrane metalloprotease [Spirochaetales bacterium]|nr:PrsW family intramembrane metalloprotease [Spirochaetales bacterium]
MRDFLFNIVLAALPAAALIGWAIFRDRERPEPVGALLKAVAFGFIATLPAIFIEPFADLPSYRLPWPLDAAWRAFVVAALVEEGLKFALVRLWIFRSKAFDEVMDGIVYTMCVSLGFAFVENALYGYADRWILLLRAFTAVPMHAAASGLMGWRLGLARIDRDPVIARRHAAAGLAVAVLVHGLYDFAVFSGPAVAWAAPLVVAVAWFALLRRFRRARDLDRVRGLDRRSGEELVP